MDTRVHVRESLRHQPIGYDIRDNGCWEWFGCRSGAGYGYIRTTGVRHGVYLYAHRYVYERLRGTIPDGLVLDHLCRNKICVNPDHLEPVTDATNVLRGFGAAAINARKTHCKHGHPLSGGNLITWHGMRNCRICKSRLSAQSYGRRRGAGRSGA